MMGVIVPSISDPFYSELVRLVEQKAEERGYRVFVLDSHGKQDDEVEAFATLMSVRAAGILVASVTVDDTGRQTERFPSDIPVVAMDAPVAGNIPFVGTDNTRGIDELVRYMCRTGDPPAYFAMPNVNRVALERQGAYEATMRRLSNEPLVIEPRRTDWDFEAIGYEMGQLFFRAESLPCRSVVCANGRRAFGGLAAACGESINVGRAVGDVVLRTGRDPWISMAVREPPGSAVTGAVTCRLRLRGDAPWVAGTFPLTGGDGYWAAPVPASTWAWVTFGPPSAAARRAASRSAASSAASRSRSTPIGTSAATARPFRVSTNRSSLYSARLTSWPSRSRASVTPISDMPAFYPFRTDWVIDTRTTSDRQAIHLNEGAARSPARTGRIRAAILPSCGAQLPLPSRSSRRRSPVGPSHGHRRQGRRDPGATPPGVSPPPPGRATSPLLV